MSVTWYASKRRFLDTTSPRRNGWYVPWQTVPEPGTCPFPGRGEFWTWFWPTWTASGWTLHDLGEVLNMETWQDFCLWRDIQRLRGEK